MLIRFSRRDNPYYRIVFPTAMAHNQYPQFETQAKHNESVLILRVVRVKKANGIFVKEHGLCFDKRYPVFLYVRFVLVLVPCKAEIIHMHIVHTIMDYVKVFLPNGARG
jgi:hypothetical protein